MYYTAHTKNIDIYFNEIRNNQPLTIEDEKRLFARIANGDKSAETEIFNRVSKLAVNIAKTFTGNPDLLCDLIQEANMGILYAISKFDINLGYRFSSYARWWSRAYIINCLEMMNIVKRKCHQLDCKVNTIKKDFLKKYGRIPSEYEILDILDAMGEKVTDLSLLHDLCIENMNDIFAESDDEQCERGELALTLSSRNSYEDKIENEELINILKRKMSMLSDREKKFVALKFGIGCEHEFDYDVIADMESVNTGKPITAERVRQIIKGAIEKMR